MSEDQSVPDIETSSSEIPMSAPTPEAAPTADPEYEYTARGKTIKEPVSMILKRASQGYDYAQSMAEFNKRQLDFDNKYKSYSEINEYASTNPEWWNHVRQAYQNRSAQSAAPQAVTDQSVPPDLDPIIAPLRERLEKTEQFQAQLLAKEQQKANELEDAKLNEEIEGIRKTYPHLDFTQPDHEGKSLEYKVLEYGVQNGIKSFKTAFRDFHHDELIKRARDEGRDLTMKDAQRKTKLGLLGESSTPLKVQVSPEQTIRGKSYDNILDEALQELGLNQKRR